jgi:prophage regulatory protein
MSVLLRSPEVERRTGLSKASIYNLIRKGEFPKPVKISERAIGWVEEEIERYVEGKINARDDAAIKYTAPTDEEEV